MEKSTSLEHFFTLREKGKIEAFFQKYLPNIDKMNPKEDSLDRDFVRSEERRLIKNLSKLGINMGVFKRERKYLVTEDVSDFLTYFLDYFEPHYIREIKRKAFSSIKQEHLIELRIRFISALYSVGYDQCSVENIAKRFEKATGCPALLSVPQTSEFTSGIINYLKATQVKFYPKNEIRRPAFDLLEHEWRETFGTLNFEKNGHFECSALDHLKPLQVGKEDAPSENMESLASMLNSGEEQGVVSNLSEADWTELTSLIEYQYHYTWHPQLVEECTALFRDYCKQHNIFFKVETAEP